MKSRKFHCLLLMRKYISKTMNMIDQLLIIVINLKKNSYLNNYLKKLSCQTYCFKHIVSIFSLIRTAFLSVYENIVRIKKRST